MKSTRNTSCRLQHRFLFQITNKLLFSPPHYNKSPTSDTTISSGGSRFVIKELGQSPAKGRSLQGLRAHAPSRFFFLFFSFLFSFFFLENEVLRNVISSFVKNNCKMFNCLKSSGFCLTLDSSNRHSRPLEMSTSFFKQRLASMQAYRPEKKNPSNVKNRTF